MKSSSAMLLTGVWAVTQPLLRFREHLFCRLLRENYLKTVWITYIQLKSNQKIQKYIKDTLSYERELNKRFSYTWSKVWLFIIFKDKITYYCDQIMQNLEINKRLWRLIEQKNAMIEKRKKGDPDFEKNYQEIASMNYVQKFLQDGRGKMIKLQKKDLKDLLEDFYGERMFKIHSTFPKEFLHILLKPGDEKGEGGRSPNETRRELVNFLFDTLFYVVCDVVSQIQVITQGARMFDKDGVSDSNSHVTRERELAATRPREKSQSRSAQLTRRPDFRRK